MLNISANNPEITLQQALQHHHAGNLPVAEALCRQVLQQHPGHAQALFLLGVMAAQDRHYRQAVELLQQAAAGAPNRPEIYDTLGSCLYGLGRLDEALAAYQQAVALQPDFAEALSNLSQVLREKQRHDEAIQACQKAITLRPTFPPAFNNLGSALGAKGRLAESIEAFRKAVALDPQYGTAFANLAQALAKAGRTDEALPYYRQALTLIPEHAETWRSFGETWFKRERYDAAVAACQRAVELRPDYAEAYNTLGASFQAMDQYTEAIDAYRKAIAQRPEYALARDNLATVLSLIGRHTESRAEFQRALALRPDDIETHCHLLFHLHYDPKGDPQMIAEAHRHWSRCHAQPLKHLIRPHANDRDPNRRLKIGYVSPDFRRHPVAPMVLPLIATHDHAHFEVFCYAQVPQPDVMTARFQQHAQQWRSTVGLSDQQVAEQIRQDQIDILVDLAGHTAGNRLLVFAQKPAPVQVARQGYPDTTGLNTIDYRMTDAYADPPGLADTLHTERLIRLPQTNWLYQPPPEEASVEPCPFESGMPITFGCFNTFAKVTEPMLHLWAQILQAVPQSRLLLKGKQLVSEDVRRHVLALFHSHGISADRLELVGKTPKIIEHMHLYRRMTIALDPFPYHGTTSTCEALWMGVPVITLAGQTHVSRVGVSLLTNVGTPELIAQTPEEYLRIAVDLATDRPRLTHLHAMLRQMLQSSPIMDYPRFARHVENAYRTMWHTWCARQSA